MSLLPSDIFIISLSSSYFIDLSESYCFFFFVFFFTPQCPKDKQLKDEVHDEFNKLLKALNEPDGQFTLCVANRLYGEKTYEFVEVIV